MLLLWECILVFLECIDSAPSFCYSHNVQVTFDSPRSDVLASAILNASGVFVICGVCFSLYTDFDNLTA